METREAIRRRLGEVGIKVEEAIRRRPEGEAMAMVVEAVFRRHKAIRPRR